MADHDGGIYIAGGYDEDGGRKRLQYLSLNDGTLTKLGEMGENRTQPACALYNYGLVVAGGWSGNTEIIGDVKPIREVEYFDFAAGDFRNKVYPWITFYLIILSKAK